MLGSRRCENRTTIESNARIRPREERRVRLGGPPWHIVRKHKAPIGLPLGLGVEGQRGSLWHQNAKENLLPWMHRCCTSTLIDMIPDGRFMLVLRLKRRSSLHICECRGRGFPCHSCIHKNEAEVGIQEPPRVPRMQEHLSLIVCIRVRRLRLCMGVPFTYPHLHAMGTTRATSDRCPPRVRPSTCVCSAFAMAKHALGRERRVHAARCAVVFVSGGKSTPLLPIRLSSGGSHARGNGEWW